MGSVLSDSSVLGNLLASLFAYRSQPIGWDLVILGAYWVVVLATLKCQSTKSQQTPMQVTAEQV
jgi:high-affinity iron transporter